MPQVTALIKTLKAELKAEGVTYQQVAEQLGVSEATVKRMFAEENFTLQRLESICQMLGLEMFGLMQKMAKAQQCIAQLTRDQEQIIANDLTLMLVTICVMNGYSFTQITEHYAITPTECVQKLAILDRLKMIELLPKNRIKLLVATHFSWLPNGPIQCFFREKVEKEFFASAFNKDSEQLLVVNALLSKASNVTFQKKMQQLSHTFSELAQADSHLPLAEREGATMVLAVRQWQYSLFEKLRR